MRSMIGVVAIAAAVSFAGCGRGGGAEKAVYYCPMHPAYTSTKPGDCPICNMRLVKRDRAAPGPSAPEGRPAAGKAAGAPEKTLHEVCVEHECTMEGCPMMVRAHVRPGERLACPVCGEVIGTESGKVVEIAPPRPAPGAAAPPGARKILYYRNPMNPEVTSPVPMKDSMGMEYVPVYEEAPGAVAGTGVYIPEEQQRLAGVRTAPVTKRMLEKVIRATGKIAYDPELFVVQEEFVQAVENQERLKDSPAGGAAERAESLTEAARRRLRLLGMSDDQIARLAKTKKADSGLYLPGKGERVWAYLAIYENEIALVKVGDRVELSTPAYPGRTFEGTVTALSPVLDPMTRTNQVRVEVGNREDVLKPEMFVNGVIIAKLGDKLAVPESAVLNTGLRTIVYLARPGGYLESREMRLGQKAEGYYEVLSGLSEGDSVVISGNFLIDSESRLKSALGGDQTQGHRR